MHPPSCLYLPSAGVIGRAPHLSYNSIRVGHPVGHPQAAPLSPPPTILTWLCNAYRSPGLSSWAPQISAQSSWTGCQLYCFRPLSKARALHVRRPHFQINSGLLKTGQSPQPLPRAALRSQELREPASWLPLDIIYQNEIAFALPSNDFIHMNLSHR